MSAIAPLRPQTPPKATPDVITTPYTTKRIRQFSKIYINNLSKLAFRKLTKANETNAAKASITEHRIESLKEAL